MISWPSFSAFFLFRDVRVREIAWKRGSGTGTLSIVAVHSLGGSFGLIGISLPPSHTRQPFSPFHFSFMHALFKLQEDSWE